MTARGTRLRILPTAPEETLTVLDLAYRLDYYCFVLFDYFSLLLHFLTSLVKLILWLKFFERQKAGGGHGVLLRFTGTQNALKSLLSCLKGKTSDRTRFKHKCTQPSSFSPTLT